jgi:hypothetical protein
MVKCPQTDCTLKPIGTDMNGKPIVRVCSHREVHERTLSCDRPCFHDYHRCEDVAAPEPPSMFDIYYPELSDPNKEVV